MSHSNESKNHWKFHVKNLLVKVSNSQLIFVYICQKLSIPFPNLFKFPSIPHKRKNISKPHFFPSFHFHHSMAALSAGHRHFFRRQSDGAAEQFRNRISSPRSIALLCHHNQDPSDSSEEKTKKSPERKQKIPGFVQRFEKMGMELKEKLSPQRKGDWKDLTLMSLSFAVYVYISQKIVCAYFVWMSMPKQLW